MNRARQIVLNKQIEEGMKYFTTEDRSAVRTWNVGVDCYTFKTENKTTIIKITAEFVAVEQTSNDSKGHCWVRLPIEIVTSVFVGFSFGMIEGDGDTCFSNFYF